MIARLQAGADQLAPETRGAIGMCAAMFVFICMDAVAKHLAASVPPMQVVWARYTGQTVLIAIIFLPSLARLVRTSSPKLQLLRSVLLFATTSLFFTGLETLPLAEATALMEIAPLLVTLLAALVLGERVGPRRWAGVAAGLVGALIILRPGIAVLQPAALLIVLAALSLAAYQVATRAMAGADSIWTTMLYTTLVGAIAASCALPWIWVTPDLETALLLVAIGPIGFVGHLALVWALSQAEASALAPFSYSQLIWSITLGWLAFGEFPDGPTLVGAGVIVCAGLYVWHRERVRKAPSRRPAR